MIAWLAIACFVRETQHSDTAVTCGADGLIEICLGEIDPTNGCLARTCRRMPCEYWDDQVNDVCSELDLDNYFRMDGHCWLIGGTCESIWLDPAVERCEQGGTDCCAPYPESCPAG